jgi:anti-sigma factor RsiW
MNEIPFQQLLEAARVRALSQTEEASVRAWIAAHPAARAVWEEERQLDELLRRLPDAPVSSNFTAQVLTTVRRETPNATAPGGAPPWWSPWLAWPRLATATALVALGAFSLWQVRLQQRAQLAASVEALSGVAAVPTVEMLADFDAIARLGKLPPNTDAGVLTALQAP